MSYARELRQQRGLGVTELSHTLKLNPTTLSLAERRKLAPSKHFKEVLCKYYKVPQEQLFDMNGLAI